MGPSTAEFAAAMGMLLQLVPYLFVPIVLLLLGEAVVMLAAKRRHRAHH